MMKHEILWNMYRIIWKSSDFFSMDFSTFTATSAFPLPWEWYGLEVVLEGVVVGEVLEDWTGEVRAIISLADV